jgi:hypothetical protein
MGQARSRINKTSSLVVVQDEMDIHLSKDGIKGDW